jgi:hypothetical protein
MYREQVTKADFSLQYREACTTHVSVSVSSTSAARQWFLMICPIIVGLLALYFFLWMGGVFALVGPWVILATSMWINWRRKKASVHLDMQGMS